MRMEGLVIKHAKSEKYLGDWVSELGCKVSIDDTIKERMRKKISKGNTDQIAEALLMGTDGNSLTAIKLFEAQVIPALLFNNESWIGITEDQISELQSFQDKFVRMLMRLPNTHIHTHWDCGMELIKWRIATKKMMFLRTLMLKDKSNIYAG